MPRKTVQQVKPQLVQNLEPEWKVIADRRRSELAAAFVVADLDDHERAFLRACQQLYRMDTGCNTPFEEFFRSLVLDVQLTGSPTPNDVEHELQTFKENFASMKRDCKAFMAAYPKEVGIGGEEESNG